MNENLKNILRAKTVKEIEKDAINSKDPFELWYLEFVNLIMKVPNLKDYLDLDEMNIYDYFNYYKEHFKGYFNSHFLPSEAAKEFIETDLGIDSNIIYEGLDNILKPKDDDEINKIFKDAGITSDIISIRIRKPLSDYVSKRLERTEKLINIKVEPYKGPVPEEENENNFLKVTGKPIDIVQFGHLYFGWPEKHFEILDLLKREIIKEGVGDKYAEKKFGIKDEIKDFEDNFKVSNNEVIGLLNRWHIFKNPTNPKELYRNARGVIMKNGDMYFSDPRSSTHSILLKYLEKAGLVTYNKRWNVEMPTQYLTVQRVGDTNEIKVGESNLFGYPKETKYYQDAQKYKPFSELEKNRIIQSFYDKAKEKNPGFIFINETIRVDENFQDVLKPKEGVLENLNEKIEETLYAINSFYDELEFVKNQDPRIRDEVIRQLHNSMYMWFLDLPDIIRHNHEIEKSFNDIYEKVGENIAY